MRSGLVNFSKLGINVGFLVIIIIFKDVVIRISIDILILDIFLGNVRIIVISLIFKDGFFRISVSILLLDIFFSNVRFLVFKAVFMIISADILNDELIRARLFKQRPGGLVTRASEVGFRRCPGTRRNCSLCPFTGAAASGKSVVMEVVVYHSG